MADRSKIEWTDATWNPVVGCKVHGPGCQRCYAMRLAGTRMKDHPTRRGLTVPSKSGPIWNGEVRFNEAELVKPLHWRRPRLIFAVAHGDLWYEAVPTAWIDRVMAVAALSPQHVFQFLTKRSERQTAYLADPETPERVWAAAGELSDPLRALAAQGATWGGDMPWPLRNAWIGVSVEDQVRADRRREHLRAIAKLGWATWVSYEPALGLVDWSGWEFIRWMVSGGESGPDSRPSHPDWHRATWSWCDDNAIAYLFKQWGDWAPVGRFDCDRSAVAAYRGEILTLVMSGCETKLCFPTLEDEVMGPTLMLERIGKRAAGRLLDGREHNGMPFFRKAA
ncbi:protein gp37 [Tistlia consotensis]|uniref:Protein gp37 n=1 Tax=Tistlia consotensis USBA 355 TaxID=560819 RepID=A0A1Y6CRA7_9PROT|nr:DUF5131 family protein [Tistlia consotensis]SMF82941.1 protein gp37 [Tistlia consotensis USBA 355]SNS31434.1 protein gp37 [Tistlia consotensis]